MLISQDRNCGQPVFNLLLDVHREPSFMDVLKFFTVRLCPWDMHLTGRRKKKKKNKLYLLMKNKYVIFDTSLSVS